MGQRMTDLDLRYVDLNQQMIDFKPKIIRCITKLEGSIDALRYDNQFQNNKITQIAQRAELLKVSGNHRQKNQSVDIQIGQSSLPYTEDIALGIGLA